MNPLTLPLRLPFLPAEGVFRLATAIELEVIKLAEVIGDEADRQLRDPARIRRELEEAQRRRDAGEITDDELAYIENQLAETMVRVATPSSAVRPTNDRS